MILTNSVDVILAVVGMVVVDDKLDVVDASGGNVGGDEDGSAAALELAQHPAACPRGCTLLANRLSSSAFFEIEFQHLYNNIKHSAI